jgi:hypothetical protein
MFFHCRRFSWSPSRQTAAGDAKAGAEQFSVLAAEGEEEL